MKKHILTDADGVILNWEEGFNTWMQGKGYVKIPDYDVKAYSLHLHFGIPKTECKRLIREFNESSAVALLPPMRDAVKEITKLYKAGYEFTIITSMSLTKSAYLARMQNLKFVFPDVEFKELICLDTGADKNDILAKKAEEYPGAYWIEDKNDNSLAGLKVGLDCFLMDHEHNRDLSEMGIKRVKNWKEISDYILAQPLPTRNTTLDQPTYCV